MVEKQYKDACDECGKFAVCKGVNGKVLCPECQTAEETKHEDGAKV